MKNERKWKSSTLNINVEDDGCPVCLFLNGDHTVDNLLQVIKVLDANLASSQEYNKKLLQMLDKLAGND